MGQMEAARETWERFMGSGAGSLASVVGQNAARSAISAAFPQDFEYYMMAFELVDIEDRTVDYFVFPILPDQYSHREAATMSVKKTMGGVSVVTNPTFSPIDISISGNFGRKFSMLSGKVSHPAVADYSTASGVFHKAGLVKGISGRVRKVVLGTRVKTGYGAIKILRGIVDKSRGEINGQPLRLYMYNPAFGENYVVKVSDAKFTQTRSTNMIWNYELQLKAVAPIDLLERRSGGKLARAMGHNLLQMAGRKTISMINEKGY